MAPTPSTNSPLSLPEIKELIAYAREQKVLMLEAHGVRFQFNPLAHEVPPPAAASRAVDEDDSPHGHFRPE